MSKIIKIGQLFLNL